MRRPVGSGGVVEGVAGVASRTQGPWGVVRAAQQVADDGPREPVPVEGRRGLEEAAAATVRTTCIGFPGHRRSMCRIATMAQLNRSKNKFR